MNQPCESDFRLPRTSQVMRLAVQLSHSVCHATCAKRDLHLVVALNMDTLAVTCSSCYRNGCWICHVMLHYVYMHQAVTQHALHHRMLCMK